MAAIAISLLIVLVNYEAFSGYDFLALRYTVQKLPWMNVLLASFVSYAISNNTGYGRATGGSVRFRFYNAWDIHSVEGCLQMIFVNPGKKRDEVIQWSKLQRLPFFRLTF